MHNQLLPFFQNPKSCDALFQGEWLNDMLHGVGIYRHMEGDVYTGQFYENDMHGIGSLVAAD